VGFCWAAPAPRRSVRTVEAAATRSAKLCSRLGRSVATAPPGEGSDGISPTTGDPHCETRWLPRHNPSAAPHCGTRGRARAQTSAGRRADPAAAALESYASSRHRATERGREARVTAPTGRGRPKEPRWAPQRDRSPALQPVLRRQRPLPGRADRDVAMSASQAQLRSVFEAHLAAKAPDTHRVHAMPATTRALG
jgi:hypothetical protein